MELKNFARAIGIYFFTEVLCLFLALTLSAIGGSLLRIISALCTLGILVCICINFAVNRAKADQRQKLEDTVPRKLFLSGSVALPYVLFGCCLILSKAQVLPGTVYRWYKLLDAPFLQLCNLVSMDVTAASIGWGQVLFLALCNLLPFGIVWITYTLTRKGFTPEELQFAKR